MRIIQAAAVSYYFEDRPSCLGRKRVAVPIIAEVRDEAWEAGQTRASGQDEGHVERSVSCARSEFPFLFFFPVISDTATSGIKQEFGRFLCDRMCELNKLFDILANKASRWELDEKINTTFTYAS